MLDRQDTSSARRDTSARDEAQAHQQRGTHQLLLARLCFFASGYVISVILARTLGAAEYGIYGVVMSQLSWIEMVTTAGVPGATAKLMADGADDSRTIESSGRAILVGLSLVLMAICWLLAPSIARLMQVPGRELVFRIAVLDLPLAAAYASYDGVLYGHGRFGVLAGAQMLYAALKLTGVLVLVSLGLSVDRVLAANVLATCTICGVLTARLRPHGFRPAARVVREIGVIAAPLALYLLSSQVLINLDLWSLKSLWHGEGAAVGHYVASGNLARTLTLIPAAQGGVLFASIAWATAAGDRARARRHVQAAIRFALVIAAGSIVLAMDAAEVLAVLYSPPYAAGGPFLRVQLAGFGMFALLDAFSHALMAAGHQWLVAGALLVSVPVVWAGTFLLIPRIGPIGAAAGMLAGLVLSAVLTGAAAHRRFGAVTPVSTLLRVAIAAAVVAAISAVVPASGAAVLLKLLLLGGLYLLILCVLGEISRKDLEWSRRT